MFPAFDLSIGQAFAVIAFSYMLGAIPFGIVMSRLFGLGDLRQIGSGNIGATNVLRTGNKTAALMTLLLDAGKGGFAVLLAGMTFGPAAAQLAGLCAFIGHCYPITLKFQGGKGVATFLGILLTLSFPAGIAACATWLVTAFTTRISSASALAASATAPIWLWVFGQNTIIFVVILLAILIWFRHHSNITRILAGEEPKIGSKGEKQ